MKTTRNTWLWAMGVAALLASGASAQSGNTPTPGDNTNAEDTGNSPAGPAGTRQGTGRGARSADEKAGTATTTPADVRTSTSPRTGGGTDTGTGPGTGTGTGATTPSSPTGPVGPRGSDGTTTPGANPAGGGNNPSGTDTVPR